MSISLTRSFTASATQSCHLNYQIQSRRWNELDDNTEEMPCSRLPVFGAWCTSSGITLIMRVASVVEVFFKGSYTLLTSPFTETPIINATTGIHELCIHMPKNVVRTLFTVLEFFIEIPMLLIEPKDFIMIVAECMKRNLKHAEARTLSSDQHKKDLACVEGLVKPRFMKYQGRMFNRDPSSQISIRNKRRPIKFWEEKSSLNRTNRLSIDTPRTLEQANLSSKLDRNIQISKSNWAVTVVTCPSGWSKNQPLIIVEGLANDYLEGILPSAEYFMHVSELHPPIKSDFISRNKYIHKIWLGMKRTEVHVKSSEQVVKMLQQIKKEETIQRQQLCIEGKEVSEILVSEYDSLFYGGNRNPLKWVKNQLKTLDIDIEESQINIVVEW